jgi:hypothetical protein
MITGAVSRQKLRYTVIGIGIIVTLEYARRYWLA